MSNYAKAIKGVIVPVITPVDSQERVDIEAFKAAIDYCIDTGIDGIFVGGSAGMGPLLTEDQWKIMIETAADYVEDRCILFGGIICTSTANAIKRIRFLEKCGYNYMAVTPTYYITLDKDEQFLEHFQACKEATEMEMIVYNIPSCTYSQIPLNVLEKMAQKGIYSTIKESSGDKAYFNQVIEIGKKYNLTILQGNEPDIEWGLSMGAGGIVPVCANYEPRTFITACKAAVTGDKALLERAQERIDFIRDKLLVKPENFIAGIMYGMSTLGIGNGTPMRPLLEISDDSKKDIDSLSVIELDK